MKLVLFYVSVLIVGVVRTHASDTLWTGDHLPPLVRMVRAYGGDDERLPPLLLLAPVKERGTSTVGSLSVTIELDIAASVPPNLVAVLQHCTAV